MKKFLALAVIAIVVVCGFSFAREFAARRLAAQTPALSQPVAVFADRKQRGVSWVAGPQAVMPEDFEALADNHANWIVQTPFGWQEDYNSPRLALATEDNYWGETDAGLIATAELARERGIRTLLKPHIWLFRPSEGKWRADIAMASEGDWQRWFADYRKFMLHYAQLAESQGMPILCIGTELQTAAVQRERDWRSLIAEIRQVYGGKLTYAANWHDEFEAVRFWDALDFIGIQAYFPLAETENPTVEDLKAGWQTHLPSIERVQAQYEKPVIFTEIGYRSAADGAIAPWEWPAPGSELRPTELATAAGLDTQANCYEAFFQTVWPKEWLAGAHFWKWFPKLHASTDGVGKGFTPQNKPAEQVMGNWYEKASARESVETSSMAIEYPRDPAL